MTNTQLSSLKVGETAIIIELSGEASLQQRLLALGFRPGKHLKILRKAWLNGPFHIKIGTTEVMIRRRDTSAIKVVKN